MQIIIKGLKGFKVYKENEDYIKEKFCKFEKMVKEPTVLEFSFEHSHKSKQTIDKVVHLNSAMPGLKKQEHMEELNEHFTQSIDNLAKRFAKFLRRYRGKQVDLGRRQKNRNSD